MKDFDGIKVAKSICVNLVKGIILALLIAVMWHVVNVHECGMCGADTVDVYHVSNMDYTEIIDVCEHCYLLCME